VELSSSAFAQGSAISRRHSCPEQDLSPPMNWRGMSRDAVSLALIVDDPDAPGGTFTLALAGGVLEVAELTGTCRR
jgi:hypothetical protein